MANFDIKENLDIKSTGISAAGQNSLPKTGDIIPFAGTVAPSGWAICDGTSGTPDLRGRYPLGSNSSVSIGSATGTSTHGHVYGTNSFNVDGAVNSHDTVDIGIAAGGNGAVHAHSVGSTFGSGSGANNLLANSTSSGGPIQFVAKPHSHNGSGNVNYNNAGVGSHTHNGFGLLSSNRADGHATGHTVTVVPSGNTSQGSSLIPFIIMNYIMKI